MATIKDIADKVGVSTAAVSRVLNHDMTLALSTRKRQAILETAEALHYTTPRNRRRAEQAGAGLKRNKIALVHFLRVEEELNDPYYLAVRLGIEARMRELELEPVRIFRNELKIAPFIPEAVSGAITVGCHMDSELAVLQMCRPNVVLADFSSDDEELDCVSCDLASATRRLLAELVKLDYRKIAFIGGPHRKGDYIAAKVEPRLNTYLRWMEEAGMYDPQLCGIGDFDTKSGYTLTQDILASGACPDVLIASNDSMAIGAYKAILEKGLTIPGDVAVVGFNDIPAAQFLAPSLSTVKIFAEDIGAAAVDLLKERLEGRDYTKRISIAAKIIWRDSSRKPEGID